MATVATYPNRNVQLRQGALIIRRNDGEPKPEPPRDPNLKSWSLSLIGGKKMQSFGVIEAVDEGGAIGPAVESYEYYCPFGLDDQSRRVVSRRKVTHHCQEQR
jgi:hypothetical protein